VEGRIRYAIQEERLNGRKNAGGTPHRAIEACLRFAGLKPKDIVRLAYGSLRTTPAQFRATDQRRKFLSESTLRGTLMRAFAWRPYYQLNPNLGWRERVRDAQERVSCHLS
jgi:predicted NodU family carbamoyl transferase